MNILYMFRESPDPEKKEWLNQGISPHTFPQQKKIDSTFQLPEQKCPNTNHHNRKGKQHPKADQRMNLRDPV